MSGSAEGALAAAVRGGLAALPGLNGAYPGRPVRGSAPYGEIVETLAADWSTKDARGREVRLAVRLHDAGEGRARIDALADACARVVEGLPDVLDGWRIASRSFVRARTVSDAPGRWIAVVEHRVRMLDIGGEGE